MSAILLVSLMPMKNSIASFDVGIIRGRIELAMREFTDAQRRYEYAEKEFVDAKLDLHGKRELKEQLTEHLLLIIQEVRAAGTPTACCRTAAGG